MPRAAKRVLVDFAKRRREMVEHQVAARGVRSELVLEAMRKVPREEFLPRICESSRMKIHLYQSPRDRQFLSLTSWR